MSTTAKDNAPRTRGVFFMSQGSHVFLFKCVYSSAMNFAVSILVGVLLLGGAVLYFAGGGTEQNETADTSDEVTDEMENTEPGVVVERGEIKRTGNVSTPTAGAIDLSGQGLTRVPDSVFDVRNTEILDVSHNELDGALQAEVRHLSNLRILDLSDNNFTGVPAEVGQLAKLEILDLSNNPITGLPHELGNLKNLQMLDLRGTDYSAQDLEVIRAGLSANVDIRTD